MPINQQSRILGIVTKLGPDVLAARSITVEEAVGRLFHIEADLRSEKGGIKFDDILGHNVTIRLELGAKKIRYFNGFVSRFTQLANVGGHAKYRAEIVPWLWFLTRNADCRIFQEKSVPEILEGIFKERGFSDYKLNLSGSYSPREYCVQYRETDFHFVSRLMEEEGIFYYFVHENGKHTMQIADSKSAHKPFEGYAEVSFRELEQGAAPEREVITSWVVEKEIQPVTYALNDFNFQKSRTALNVVANVSRSHGGATFEIYDYPGEYLETTQGDHLAQVRLDELQSQHEVGHGEASARGLAAGCSFKMKEHPRVDQNREYLITKTSIHVDSGDYGSGGEGGGAFFTCQFTSIPLSQAFRPSRLTPKPVVQGPQTAIVVAPAGEEIHVDKFGRVKVHFHWDRHGKADENASCWTRVSQAWAGKQWGSIYTPRKGQEVIVEFLEGDPDRPIITGRVYNDSAMPPYALPAHKTISTTKSSSTKGGQGFNEIRFEDKKGEEQIFIHAEKNQDIRVKNDAFEWIGHNSHLVVKKDKFEHVEHNREETVDADHIEKIGKDRHLQVGGKEARSVEATLSLTVTGDVIEVFKANHSEETSKDFYLKATNIVIEASSNITLKVGGSSIAIEAGGIGIKTSGQLKIESGGPAELKAGATLKLEGGAMAELKSPMTSVKSDGITVIQGALVKIN